ncbi:MAG: C10 family peptidase [Bacteroidia bacterium]|nr:C10 family peptidase [Bacteroidia bacterium]
MKKLYIVFLLLVISIGLFAAPVSFQSAQTVAVNVYKHYAEKTTDFTVSDVVVYKSEQITTFYVFVFNAGGFVIVAADDAVLPILGYSTLETFDKNNIPLNAAGWLENYNNHIRHIVNNNLSNKETVKEWNKILNNQFNKSTQAVNPLCATTWDQSSPYNNLCPSGSVTGCVATAMAQIMKYWNYPTTGVGTHTYTHATYGALTANFGATTYQWANMLNSYSGGSTATQKTAVATLMYHAGVSVDMDYSPSASGAYSFDVPNALISYFNYSPSAEIKFLANFTSANWINMLKGELDASHPIYYSGTGPQGGHAFVCDGYNTSNQFHFNWGWGGMANGYFAIGSLNPIGDTFNEDNSAVIRIKPPSSAPLADFVADNVTPPVAGIVNFTDNSTNNPTSWNWTFDGGTPSTSNVQFPTITYNTPGIYQVSLTVTNGTGSDTKIRSSYINVGGTPSAWIKQNTGFATASRGIDQVFIVNPYTVWAKAFDGSGGTTTVREFTRTVNGGITWTPGVINFTNATNYGVANIFAFDDSICYAAMFPTGSTGGVIVKTVDAGNTWSTANSPGFSTSWLDFVHFFNTNDGVCVGDPAGNDFVIYTTANGGTTWTQVSIASLPNCLSGEAGITNLYDAFGNTIWFGTSSGRVYKSSNKGLTWTVSATGLGTSAIVKPVFKDANVGFVTGTQNASPYTYIGMKKTIDGGTTWTTFNPTGFFVKSPELDFIPGTTSTWVNVSASVSSATTNPGSSYSVNDCSSFLDIDTGSVQYTTVSFFDINTGWAGGFNTNSTDGGIWKWNNAVITAISNTVATLIDEIKIFPNPVTEIVNIEFLLATENKIKASIYNLIGEKIISKEISAGTNNAIINMEGYKAGVYLLTIDDGSKIITKRVHKIN